LPRFEGDTAFVLLAGSVLGEEDRPAPGIAGDRDTALLLRDVDAYSGAHLPDDLTALLDEPGPGVRASNPEVVAATRVRADATVTEVEAQ
jgi:hypothetical protein